MRGGTKDRGVSDLPKKQAALADLPEIVALKRRRRRLFLCVTILLLTVAFGGRAGYDAFKKWRCRDLAAKSVALAAESKLDEALATARSAHQLVPDEPEALRAVGQVLVARGDYRNAMAFFAEAVKRSPSSADRLQFGECALRAGLLKEAEGQLVQILAESESSPSTHLFAARVYAARLDFVSAVAAVRKSIELSPDGEARLLLGQLLVREGRTRAEGVELLESLAREKSSAALGALRHLASRPGQEGAELLKMAAALRSHALAAQPEHLRALELEMRALPTERAARLDRAEIQYAGSSPAELRSFASWLVAQEEPERALRLLPEERVLSRKDLFAVRLDAMAAMGQWRDILTLLEKRAPLESALVHLYRARCWKELSDAAKSDASWRLALTSASGDVNLALYLATYAEKLNAIDHAKRAYRLVANHPHAGRLGFDGLLRLTPRTDSMALQAILGEMAQKWPHDAAVANDLAYLDVLLGQKIEENRQRAKELVAASPQSLPHRTVLALAELREGDPQAALRVYDGLRIDWKTVAPGAAAVYASVLRKTGYTTEADNLAAALQKEQLRPEERELLAWTAVR